MNFHWQNLNEDHRGNVKGWPHRGRGWLHFGTDARRYIGIEWYLWRCSCALSFGSDEEGDLNFHIAFPPVSLFLSMNQVIPMTRPREIGIRVHDWALWWTLWRDPMGGWSRSIPRWRQGCFNFLDAVLGGTQYSNETLSDHKVSIPMPEGSYPATLRLEKATWSRPRWFRQVVFRARVNMDIPIPHEGKGENSWDCGKDALHGMTCPAKTVEDAIAEVVRSVLRSRRRYDGNVMAQYPAPAACSQ